ncbi:MAG: hypothetical protein IJI27_08155 [Oscillospiraceae bacterium]|nr:hypothetical protein [Oscillospiraceae bacterium]
MAVIETKKVIAAGAEHEITSKKFWTPGLVRQACIKNDLYTAGDNEAYSKMLGFVEENDPTLAVLYAVAKDICEHSEYQSISNVMFILERDAVYTTFEIDGSDEI